MAIQILPGQSRSAMLGGAVGTALGQGLQSLLQNKLNKMLQQKETEKTAFGLSALGIPEQEASQVAMLPKELQSLVVKNYLAGNEGLALEQALASLSGRPETVPEAIATPQAMPEVQQLAQPSQEMQMLQPSPEQQRSTSFQEILRRPNLKPEQRLKIEQMMQRERLAQQKVSTQEQKEINQETLPYYKETLKEYKGAKENERRLDRMDQLVRKGKLDSPTFSSILDTASKGIFGFGINLDSLRSPDSQEFKKLSTEFLKNAKNLFGNRVTDNEIKLFMQMVPTLNQSDKGKLRVINNMKAYNQAEALRKEAMDKIIKENGGRRPRNLESLVESTIAPALDSLAEEFKKGYNIDAEPAEDKSSFLRRASEFLEPKLELPF